MGKNSVDRRALSEGRGRSGLSLTKFAQAKSSTYDKRARNEQLKALHARKASKYRRLRARLEKEGRLEPILREENEEKANWQDGQDKDLQRALKRAGPTLDEDSSDSDAVGAASPPGSPEREGGSAEATAEGLCDTASPNVAGDKAEYAVEESKKRKPTAHKRTDGKSAPKQKRKKPKPLSQVQLLAAKVQAQKDKQQAEREKRQQETEVRQKRISEKEKQRKKEREAYLKKTKRGQPVMKHRVDKMLAKLQAELA